MKTVFLIPMFALVPAAVYAGGVGLAMTLPAPLWAGLAISAGLHAAWLLAAVERSLLLLALGWLCCCRFAAAGNAFGTFGAFLLQVLLLLLAFGVRPGVPVAQRLASYRRTRTAIQAQLMMADGLCPWFRLCARQLFNGKSEHKDQTMDRAMFLAELEDAGRTSTAINVIEKRDNYE
jgi:hypothetical protein